MLAATVVVVGFMAFCAGLAVWGMKHAKKTRSNFEQLSRRLGFVLAPRSKKPAMLGDSSTAVGEIRGRPGQLLRYATGHGKHRVTWSALTLALARDGGLTFEISRQGLGTKFSQLFGAREITVGSPAFDSAWFIQTNQP